MSTLIIELSITNPERAEKFLLLLLPKTYIKMLAQPTNFINHLRLAIQNPLPGTASQMKMVPAIRRQEMQKRQGNDNAREAAVLICFFPDENGKIFLALIRRNEYDGVHSGQISFPGGKSEADDRNLEHTALRETEEEIGVPQDQVEILGAASQVYIPPSNFLVSPFIGWLKEKPVFIPDSNEVTEIVKASLDELMNPENRQVKDIKHREYNIIDVPCFYIQGHIIWGATAMMLSEVVDLLTFRL